MYCYCSFLVFFLGPSSSFGLPVFGMAVVWVSLVDNRCSFLAVSCCCYWGTCYSLLGNTLRCTLPLFSGTSCQVLEWCTSFNVIGKKSWVVCKFLLFPFLPSKVVLILKFAHFWLSLISVFSANGSNLLFLYWPIFRYVLAQIVTLERLVMKILQYISLIFCLFL